MLIVDGWDGGGGGGCGSRPKQMKVCGWIHLLIFETKLGPCTILFYMISRNNVSGIGYPGQVGEVVHKVGGVSQNK